MPPRKSTAIDRAPIVADRVRSIGQDGFAFIPNRFLRDGFLASLTREELALYLFLVLAGDRRGTSFYRYDSICSVLEMTIDGYIAARNALIAKDLIAFDGTRFQVLSLPTRPSARESRPLRTRAELTDLDPATIRIKLRAALERDPDLDGELDP